MNMEVKPNSHKYKEEQKANATEEKRVEKVVGGAARTKKKSEISKLTDVFIAEDAANVKSYILSDVLVPALKKLISDIVKDGIEMVLYGGVGGGSRRDSGRSSVSYRKYYDERRDDRGSRETRARSRFDYDDIVFETRGDAEAVREQMECVIDRYGFVTVADMYDLADLTQPYTSNKYGWYNLHSADVVRVRDGYILKLPKAEPIDR